MRINMSFSYKAPPRNSKVVSKYEHPSNSVDHAMQHLGGKVHSLIWKIVDNQHYHIITKSQSRPIHRKETCRNNIKSYCDSNCDNLNGHKILCHDLSNL